MFRGMLQPAIVVFGAAVLADGRASPSLRRRIGYGARAAVAFGLGIAGLDEIVSFTVPANRRSRRVMERIGMTSSADDDFDHPGLPEGHPLRRHVLYRIERVPVER